jgi:hypothetical protein
MAAELVMDPAPAPQQSPSAFAAGTHALATSWATSPPRIQEPAMTPRRTRHHQPRPNRRFRRLLPTAVLTATLAAASSGGPAAARADAQRAGHRSPPPARVLATDAQAPPTADR